VPFATTSLACRIDRAEADTAAAFAKQSEQTGNAIVLTPIGGTQAVYGGPGQPFNKLAGLGFGEPLTEEDVVRLEAVYDRLGAELRVEQSSLADPQVAAMLTRRGYALAGYENVLGIDLTPQLVAAVTSACERARGEGIEVARVAGDQSPTWVATVAEGFLSPDSFDGPPPTESFTRETMERIFADFGGAPGCLLYLARRNGEVAGGGSLRIVDGLAQLSGAATLPAHRRRGVQSTLLAARLAAAAAAGCDMALVTTEPASKSQQNVERVGFRLLYVRAILVRPPSGVSESTRA
jgi:GNAT superfamily N-acetyltransferase